MTTFDEATVKQIFERAASFPRGDMSAIEKRQRMDALLPEAAGAIEALAALIPSFKCSFITKRHYRTIRVATTIPVDVEAEPPPEPDPETCFCFDIAKGAVQNNIVVTVINPVKGTKGPRKIDQSSDDPSMGVRFLVEMLSGLIHSRKMLKPGSTARGSAIGIANE